MTTTVRILATLCGLAAVAVELPAQRPGAPPVTGRWDITVTGADATYPSWLEVQWSGDRVLVGRFVGRSGSSRPISRLEFVQDTLRFSIPPQWDQGEDLHFEGVLAQDRLAGWMTEASGTRVNWTAVRAPTLRRSAPPQWGRPDTLFNGVDLTGWRTFGGTSNWKVVDHVLTNESAGANLATRDSFTDFKLHIEFRYPKDGNSGIYLRGRYEVQVEDTPGTEPLDDGLGSVYGFLMPSEIAAKQPGEWQTYDITLVGRLITVVLNGRRVLCNEPIPGITGGALDSNEGAPGPIYLQGDEVSGPIQYRNIVLTPASSPAPK
jgi:3-keto-disaccharide hydrolase